MFPTVFSLGAFSLLVRSLPQVPNRVKQSFQSGSSILGLNHIVELMWDHHGPTLVIGNLHLVGYMKRITPFSKSI